MKSCPHCNSKNIRKRGIRSGNQKHSCNECGKYFTTPLEVNADIADGYLVKGQSKLYDADGNVKLTWEKTDRNKEQQFNLMRQAITELAKAIKPIDPIPYKEQSSSQFANVIPIGDPHVGMYSAFNEVGEEYTTEKAKDLFTRAMTKAIDKCQPCDECYIINVGDFFHTDNSSNKTARSGNALDVDGRFNEIVKVGVHIVKTWIMLALEKHKTVHMINAIGNHDDHSSQWLNIAIDALFSNNDRVIVHDNASQFQYFTFGFNLIGVTHGDTAKMPDLGGIMATDVPEKWGNSIHRYWYTGHVHHDQVKEYRGYKAESFRTLAGKDAWHHASGYRSDRDIKVIVLHADYGEVERFTFNIEQFKE
jgi:transcription elongation factor Elf1